MHADKVRADLLHLRLTISIYPTRHRRQIMHSFAMQFRTFAFAAARLSYPEVA